MATVPRLQLDDDEERVSCLTRTTLVGKVIWSKDLSLRTIQNIIAGIWKIRGKLHTEELGKNLFLFHFEEQYDSKRILGLSPWTIMNQLLLLRPWEPGILPNDIDMCWCPFWVQGIGLPLEKISSQNAKKIGGIMGKYVEDDIGEQLGHHIKSVLRIKVLINVTEPLKKGFNLSRDSSEDVWVSFKYERLGDYCYKCGRLGHDNIICKYEGDCDEVGPALRASTKSESGRQQQHSRSVKPTAPEVESGLLGRQGWNECEPKTSGDVEGWTTKQGIEHSKDSTVSAMHEIQYRSERTTSGMDTWQNQSFNEYAKENKYHIGPILPPGHHKPKYFVEDNPKYFVEEPLESPAISEEHDPSKDELIETGEVNSLIRKPRSKAHIRRRNQLDIQLATIFSHFVSLKRKKDEYDSGDLEERWPKKILAPQLLEWEHRGSFHGEGSSVQAETEEEGHMQIGDLNQTALVAEPYQPPRAQ